MKTEYIVAIVVVVVVVLLIIFRNKITDAFTSKKTTQLNPSTGTQQQPVVLDGTKWLYKNVQGAEPEVRKLQQLLGGLDVDGDFGPKTEARLFERKQVVQTTLNAYATIPDAAPEQNGATGDFSEDAPNTSFSETAENFFNNSIGSAFSWVLTL